MNKPQRTFTPHLIGARVCVGAGQGVHRDRPVKGSKDSANSKIWGVEFLRLFHIHTDSVNGS